MNFVIDFLKGQFNTLNLILFLACLYYLLGRWRKERVRKVVAWCAGILLVLSSTGVLTLPLLRHLESEYSVFSADLLAEDDSIYVCVLGGGYTADKTLPASGQLSSSSLGRLVEGVRVQQLYGNSILVCSGYAASGRQSLATVMKAAAVTFGVQPDRIVTLDTPTNTREESLAFAETIGKNRVVIVVTDAIHMRRAMRYFSSVTTRAYAAPANFLVKKEPETFVLVQYWPSIEHIRLTDVLLRVLASEVKASLH